MTNAAVAQQQGQSDLATQIREQVRQQVQEAQRQAQEAQRAAQEAARQAAQNPGEPVIAVPPPPPPPQLDMMPPQVFDITIFFFITVAVIIIGLPIARALGRRLDRKPYKQAIDPGMSAQLQRIENTVESMSIEIERISEAQRYMARLQTERAEPASLPRSDAS
jgi:soluble lytic murein transglycosylase-like protein